MKRTLISRTLGKHGPTVSSIGLGATDMSDLYGKTDRAESIATIRAALGAGITLIDTGDFYGSGHNELLIREALTGCTRESVVLSVKFGVLRDPAGGWGGIDNRPAALKSFLAQSLQRLGTDYIDIYRPARLDPNVPIEDTVGAMAEMVKAGYVRHIGLSKVAARTIRKAHAIHPIADLQIEYSLISRGIEKDILPTLRELGIGLTAYGALSRGNLNRNLQLVEELREQARAKGVTVAQLAIAWVLAKAKDIVPLVGARSRDRLDESLGALDVELTPSEVERIERTVRPGAAAGTRYDAQLMGDLDSENARSTGSRRKRP